MEKDYERKLIAKIIMISDKELVYMCDKVATNETGVYLYNYVPLEEEDSEVEEYGEVIIGMFTKRNIAGWVTLDNPDYIGE